MSKTTKKTTRAFTNPFRPGAGHPPPYLAGRGAEQQEVARLLKQNQILENLVLTGLRGVGKTVLLESLKPIARKAGWLWIGSDLSESASVSEETLATRLLTDLSPVTSGIPIQVDRRQVPGFASRPVELAETLNYGRLIAHYSSVPGLSLDKVKAVLATAWNVISRRSEVRGIIFAYDEAQTLADQAVKEQFPLSLLLDSFQGLQRQGMPLMLFLAGLPTLFPKLVESRTYAERMFRVLFLDRLTETESEKAIRIPIQRAPLQLTDDSVRTIVDMSGGYPYFIQFICREVYDAFIQRTDKGLAAAVPADELRRKLDSDFFAGRWSRATDRQRDLLLVIAYLETEEGEFTLQEVAKESRRRLSKPFSPSQINQMLGTLAERGLVFKNRRGKYSFAVPLFGSFIRRQESPL